MEKVEQVRSRYRWWLDLRWIFLILVVSSAGMILWGLYGPEPRLIVSRETTFITAPLRPDGTPDYAAYVLDLMGRGTPPEENAAVDLLRATWPMGLDDTELAAVCKELHIPNAPPDIRPMEAADYDRRLLVDLHGFLGLPAPEVDSFLFHDEVDDRVSTLIDNAQRRPWSSEECPPLAAWIEQSSRALDLIVAGADKPRYELPLPGLLLAGPDTLLVDAGGSNHRDTSDLSKSLLIRAMLHSGEGRAAEAWRDIHAVYRLSRLLVPGDRLRFTTTHYVARQCDYAANTATIALLESAQLSATMASSIRRDLDALSPLPDARAGRIADRLELADMGVAIARLPRAKRTSLCNPRERMGLRWLLSTSLDLNLVFRHIHDEEHRVEKVLSLPTYSARRRAMNQLAAQRVEERSTAPSLEKASVFLHHALSRPARSHAVAQILLIALGPGAYNADMNEGNQANAAIVRLVAALTEYRSRRLGPPEGEYPRSLQDLVPDVLSELPTDPFSGNVFHYERRGNGFLLYSLGPDETDSGGTDYDLENGEWRPRDDRYYGENQDIVVRLPLPKRSLIPPANDASN